MRTLINRSKIPISKIWLYAFFQVLIIVTSRCLVPPLIPLISGELGVGLDYIGSAIALSVFGIFFVSLTTGSTIEIIGMRKVLLMGLGINFAGSLIMIFSQTFPLFIIAYFLLEIGYGVLIICNISIANSFYPKKKGATLLKINLGYSIGFIAAPLLVGLILFLDTGWRYYYIIHIALLMLLAIIVFRLEIPDRMRVNINLKHTLIANRKIFKHPGFLLCGIIMLFYVSVTNTFYVWFTSYFTGLDIGIDISSMFLFSYGFSTFLGMFLRNWLIRHFKAKKILLYTLMVSLLFLIAIIMVDDILVKNVLIFLFGVALSGNFSITFAISTELIPDISNSVSGFLMAFAYLGIMIFQYVSGYLSEHFSRNSVLYIDIFLLILLLASALVLNFHNRFDRDFS